MAQSQIIAHRGYWNHEGSAQNSIASLKDAAEQGFYGVEFDVHLTADGIPVIYHDHEIGHSRIEDHNFLEFRFHTLANGEEVPTLRNYLREAARHEDLRLFLEIKDASTAGHETRTVEAVLEHIAEAGVGGRTEYISFSMHVLEEILRREPGACVHYLGGELTPDELFDRNITGMDYDIEVLQRHPEWIQRARELGIATGSWTVNSRCDMLWALERGIGTITTDEPARLRMIICETRPQCK